jgi:protein-disulfide isomerase
VLEQLLEKFPQSVKVVYKNYPISSHQYAVKAAMAALAAGEQGKFWQFHDELFQNYNRLNDEKVQEISRKLQLDEARFEADRTNRDLLERIRADYQEGNRIGVRGVPAVYLNGKVMRNRSLEALSEAVEGELKKITPTQ